MKRVYEGIDHLVNIAKEEVKHDELDSYLHPTNTVPTHSVMDRLDMLRHRLHHIVKLELEETE